MGEAEVAAVREMYDAFNRGEYEEATAMLDEGVVLHQWEEIPDADTYEGREGLVRGLVRWLEGFGPGFRFDVEDAVDGGKRAVMRIRLSGRGRGSRLEVEQVVFHVWAFRDGRPSECWVFSSEDEAWRHARSEG